MASPEFQSGGESREVEQPARESALPGNPELMEKVLRETLSAADGTDQLDAAQFQSLREVARRLRGSDADEATLIRELVSSVLVVRFPTLNDAEDLRSEMSQRIAASLMDDPVNCERVRRFWTRLCEAEQ